ncbi:MAG: Gfo/Idh/MocA family oxidoreductase [Rhodobacteraceae bacterium]|nr:Gfo/Idh/MocA family oxidoreductase [Paracoccaceae bacterium]
MAQLPLVIIGAGSIGRRHIEVAQACPETRIAAVVEPSASRRVKFTSQGLNVVAALDEIPGETRAAVVATPTPDHHISVHACLDRGLPVLVEKPIADRLDHARAVLESATRNSLPLFTGHHRRCHPFSLMARKVLPNIGAIVGIQGFWSLRKHDSYYNVDWRRAPGAGPLMINLSHEIDLLRFLVGDIDEVTALSSNARRGFAIEDTAVIALRFANGAMGSFLISDAGVSPWAFEAASDENPNIAASHQDYIRITGTKGALEFPSLTRWGQSGPEEIEWSKPLVRTPGPIFGRVDPLLVQIARFAAVVNGGRGDGLCTGKDGVMALEMTLAAALSAQSGRTVRAGDVPGDFDGICAGYYVQNEDETTRD